MDGTVCNCMGTFHFYEDTGSGAEEERVYPHMPAPPYALMDMIEKYQDSAEGVKIVMDCIGQTGAGKTRKPLYSHRKTNQYGLRSKGLYVSRRGNKRLRIRGILC